MSPPRALNISWYKLGSQGIFVSGLKSSLEVIHNNVGRYFLLIKVFNKFVKGYFHDFWVAEVPVAIFLCVQQFWMFSVPVAEGSFRKLPFVLISVQTVTSDCDYFFCHHLGRRYMDHSYEYSEWITSYILCKSEL